MQYNAPPFLSTSGVYYLCVLRALCMYVIVIESGYSLYKLQIRVNCWLSEAKVGPRRAVQKLLFVQIPLNTRPAPSETTTGQNRKVSPPTPGKYVGKVEFSWCLVSVQLGGCCSVLRGKCGRRRCPSAGVNVSITNFRLYFVLRTRAGARQGIDSRRTPTRTLVRLGQILGLCWWLRSSCTLTAYHGEFYSLAIAHRYEGLNGSFWEQVDL